MFMLSVQEQSRELADQIWLVKHETTRKVANCRDANSVSYTRSYETAHFDDRVRSVLT